MTKLLRRFARFLGDRFVQWGFELLARSQGYRFVYDVKVTDIRPEPMRPEATTLPDIDATQKVEVPQWN